LIKYGVENFVFEIRESCLTRQQAIEVEACVIKELNTTVDGYNISEGGAAPILSEAGRANLSASLKRHFQSPEARKMRGDPQRGKPKPKPKVEPGCGRPQTLETRQKISEYWARRRAEKAATNERTSPDT
jgi:hypothetical protein